MSTELKGRVSAAGIGILVIAMAVVAVLVSVHNADSRTLGGQKLNAMQRRGADVFATTCRGCHSLAASNANGLVGPSLDYVQPSAAQVRSVLATGSQGAYGVMPAGLLNGDDAKAVAAYVSKVADRKNVN